MQIGEFIEATSRLEQYYDKEYTNEQRQIMFDELKDLEITRYRRLISAVIKKNKFLPKVSDIIEANIEEPYGTKNKDKEIIQCNKCNSTGYILYTKKVKNGDKFLEYTFSSICSCGNAKQYDGTKIGDISHRSDYYTPMASEINLVN